MRDKKIEVKSKQTGNSMTDMHKKVIKDCFGVIECPYESRVQICVRLKC